MSIKNFVVACLAAFCGLLSVMAILLAVGNWHDYRAARNAGQLVNMLAAATRISESMAPERGATSVALDGDAAARQTLAAIRAKLDIAFDGVEKEASATSLPEGKDVTEAVAKLRATMNDWRTKADAVSGGSPQEVGAFRKDFTVGINGALSAAGNLSNMLVRRLSALDAEVASAASLAETTWQLRDRAGQVSILHIAAITSRRPFTAEQIRMVNVADGHIEQSWERLISLAGAPDSSVGLREGLAQVDRGYVSPFKALRDQVAKAGMTDGSFDLDPAEWRRQSAPMLQAIMVMRDAAIAEAQRIADKRSGGAFRNLILMGALLGGAFATLVGTAMGLNRRVIGRLAEITETMKQLAAGNLSVTVPFSQARDEIGVMAAAVLVFKDAAIENQRLQQAREQDQIAAREHLRTEMLTLTEVLEGEVATTVGDISLQADRMTENATQLSETARNFQTMARTVAAAADTASSNVQTVAGATEELEASGRGISAQVGNSSKMAGEARHQAQLASASVSGLINATARIGDVVTLITGIAKQTRMLALNATIEAARAGEMGKGFAVVADEVKGLALQTEEGISQVRAQAEEIGATTRQAVEAVDIVAIAIQGIDDIARQVAGSADEQRSATAEIMESAVQAAGHTGDVAENAQKMLSVADQTGDIADKLSELSVMVSRDVGALQRRLGIILRNSAGGDRRESVRVAVSIPFTVELGTERFSGHTGDISASGALLVVAATPPQTANSGIIDLMGFGRIKFQVLVESPMGVHIRFLELDLVATQRLEEVIKHAMVDNQRFVDLAQGIAAKVVQAFEGALSRRQLSEHDLFSAVYRPIVGTNPPQVLAPHAELADQVLPALLEPPLATDPKIAFCCVTDRNGYIATHNRACSQPQRPSDPAWNAANARNRRIFDDRTGILAARNKTPFLVQTYVRDMGDGRRVLLKEVDTPITVNGKHWGAVRLGINL